MAAQRDPRGAARGPSLTTFYVDSSALVKLVRHEAETQALTVLLQGRSLATSVVGVVELLLTAGKGAGDGGVVLAERVIATLNLVALTVHLARDASRLVSLESLAAIHLATALSVRASLEAIVTYDERLAAEARLQGLVVLSPS